jgi:O-antigen ligase
VTGTFDRPYGGFALVPVEFLRGVETGARLSGPLGDPNYYAQILLPLIPIGLIALGGGERRHRRLVAAATLLILAGLVLTYSRGGALALVVMFCIAVAARRVRASQVVLVVLAAAIAIAVVPDYRERITSIGSSFKGATAEEGSSQAADQAVRGRTGEMAAAGLVFLDHPVLGVGPGVFPSYYQEYIARLGLEAHGSIRTGAKRGEEARREAHNLFLGIAADLGLAGLAVFLAIIATAFAGLARARRRCAEENPKLAAIATGLLIALAGYVIAGLFLSLAFERYFWLLIGLCGVVIQLSREAHESRTRPIGREATAARQSAHAGPRNL